MEFSSLRDGERLCSCPSGCCSRCPDSGRYCRVTAVEGDRIDSDDNLGLMCTCLDINNCEGQKTNEFCRFYRENLHYTLCAKLWGDGRNIYGGDGN